MKDELRKIIESAIEAMKDDSVVVIIKKVDSRYEFEPHKEDIDQQPNEVWRLYEDWQEYLLSNRDYRTMITDHEFALLMSELWNAEMHKPISDDDVESFAYFISDNENEWRNKDSLEMIGIDFDDRCIDLLVDEFVQSGDYLRILGKR